MLPVKQEKKPNKTCLMYFWTRTIKIGGFLIQIIKNSALRKIYSITYQENEDPQISPRLRSATTFKLFDTVPVYKC